MPLVDRELWARLSPLVDRSLELDGPERSEFLRSVADEDADLGRALAEQLARHDRAVRSGFLPDASEPPVATLEGHVVGPYTLVERLGVGGMGSVWRARRSDGRFEGDVAIKLLHPSLFDEAGLERFRREGTLLSGLNHPGIARLLDAGLAPSGQPYLVLELVDGERIDRWADERRLSVRERVELFLQVTDAVADAHARLVVHRDLKPSNLLVDRAGRVKLLDFGVAGLLDATSGEVRGRTLTSAALTPDYAAPEQLEGGTLTTATDVYALGVLLYELLAGEHPVARADTSPAELVRAITSVDPPRMSERVRQAARPAASVSPPGGESRERVARQLAGDLDLIVARALKKAPAERYATVAGFASDLRNWLGQRPISVRRDGALYRLGKLFRRRKLESAAVAVAVVALIASTGIAWRQARASAIERDRALSELERAEIANDLSGFLISEATPDGTPISKSELLSRAEAMIEARFADSPEHAAHMLVLLSSRFYEVADYAGWRRVLVRAHELAATTPEPRLRAVSACELAMAEADADPARSKALFAQASAELAGFDAASAAAELARCRSAEAVVANFRGDHEGAVRAAEESLLFEASRPGPSGRGTDALNSLALAQSSLGRYEEANRSFEQLFSVLAEERRSKSRAAAVYGHNWTLTLLRAGQIRRALAESETVVAVGREVGGKKPSPYALSARASVLSYVGRHAEAIAAIDEAAANAAQAVGSQMPFWIHCVAARVQAEAGAFVAADRALAEADRALAAIASPPRWFAGVRDAYRAGVLVERGTGSATDALALARQAIATLESEKRPDSDLLQPRLIAARAANDLRNGEGATHAARALGIARAGLGGFTHSRELGLAELETARAAFSAGARPAAESAFRRALENLREAVGPDAPETRRAEREAAAAGLTPD